MRTPIVALLLVLVASAAHAGKIVTPPLVRSTGDSVSCLIANTNSRAIGPFTITVYNTSSTAVASTQVATLSPGIITSLSVSDAQLDPFLFVRCEIDGKGVSKKTTPVTLCVRQGSAINRCGASVSVN